MDVNIPGINLPAEFEGPDVSTLDGQTLKQVAKQYFAAGVKFGFEQACASLNAKAAQPADKTLFVVPNDKKVRLV